MAAVKCSAAPQRRRQVVALERRKGSARHLWGSRVAGRGKHLSAISSHV